MADIRQNIILQGNVAGIDDLADVIITTVAADEILKWSGSDWINNTLAEAGVSATGHTHTQSEITDLTKTIIVDDEGSPVSGGPHDTLDFVGAGVVVTDAGSGTATVTIAGGGGGALNDLSDVTLTSPATDSILIKTAGDYIDGLVQTGSIEDAAVQYAKLQNFSGHSIIGRQLSSSGAPIELTAADNGVLRRVGINLEFGQLSNAHYNNGSVSHIKMSSVLASKIIGRGSAGGTGSREELNASGGLEISGTDVQIADGGVTLARIADAAANDRLLGSNNTGGGSPYIELLLGTNLSITGNTLDAADSGGSAGDQGYVLVDDGGSEFVVADHTNRTVVGNTRGNFAVDLQMDRANVNEVASGVASVIGGGEDNRCVSPQSVVAGGAINQITNTGGQANTISGGLNHTMGGTAGGGANTIGGGNNNDIDADGTANTISGGDSNTIIGATTNGLSTIGGGLSNEVHRSYGTVPGGRDGQARRNGEQAYGGGTEVHAQQVKNVATVRTANATPTEMGHQTSTQSAWTTTSVDSATIPFPESGTYIVTFKGTVVCMRTSSGSSIGAAFEFSGCMKKNDAGGVSFVGAPEVVVIGRDNALLSVDIDLAGSNAGARIMVTGLAGVTIVWAAEWTGCEIEVPVIA